MQTERYCRKPFHVEAIQVTDDNMEEIAAWCGGEIRTSNVKDHATQQEVSARYVKVPVRHPLSERQTKAFVGEWVLFANNGYKVYLPLAFERNFDADPLSATALLFQGNLDSVPLPE